LRGTDRAGEVPGVRGRDAAETRLAGERDGAAARFARLRVTCSLVNTVT
jgi:hypothetical protein